MGPQVGLPVADDGRERIARTACFVVLAIGLPVAISTVALPEIVALRLRFVLVVCGISAVVAGLLINRPLITRPWWFLAAGLSCSLAGDAFVLAASSDGSVTTNLPVDAWLTSIAGLLILVAMIDATRIVRGSDHGGTLDAIVFALAGGTAVWHLGVVAQAVPGWAGGGTEIAGSLQILFLVAVLGLLIRTARVLPRHSRMVMILLAFGLLLAITAFLLGAFRDAAGGVGSHYAGARAAFGAAANLLAGAAALHPTMRQLTERQVPPIDKMSLQRMAMLGIALLVPPALLVIAGIRGTPGSPPTLFMAWSLLVPTVLGRIKLLGIARDAAWRRVTSTEQRMTALVANTGDALVVVKRSPDDTEDWTVVYASPASRRQLGRHPDDLEGSSVLTVVDDDDRAVLEEVLSSKSSQPRSADVRAAAFDDDPRWLEIVVDDLLDDDVGHGVVLTIRDVTDRKRAQIHWEHAATSDVLTGLLNRRGIEARLDAAFELAVSDESLFGIIVADQDGFKEINDRHGHVVGDEVLRQVAARLLAAVRSDDDVGRIGGDEFVIISRTVDSRQSLLHVARRIPGIIQRPMYVDRHELTVNISLGVAMADVESDSIGQLIRRADAALYEAKAAGTGQVVFADEALQTRGASG